MRIWVDADACPGAIKELIIRAARRLGIHAVFVANKYIGLPDSAHLSTVRLAKDPEAVDEYIAQCAEAGDLAVTQDIPLASALIPKGVVVMTPRGELFTEANMGERLSIRNFMQDIREAGTVTPGPKPFTQKDKQRFSDAFDRELTKLMRRSVP
jgi:uncharacterized protein YaiI (UPF0178 family)